jgi:hypothetical protein
LRQVSAPRSRDLPWYPGSAHHQERRRRARSLASARHLNTEKIVGPTPQNTDTSGATIPFLDGSGLQKQPHQGPHLEPYPLKIAVVAGTNAGICKIIAGTSATPVTIVDNVGADC